MHLSRRNMIAGVIAAPFLTSRAGQALAGTGLTPKDGPELPQLPAVFTERGLAVGGYDPCSYFVSGRPAMGSPEHRLRWRGAIWQFVSKESCLTFEMDPFRYAPAYGGHCAFSMSRGMPLRGDPEVWTIHDDGRLYLKSSRPARTLWLHDRAGHIGAAEANWQRFRSV